MVEGLSSHLKTVTLLISYGILCPSPPPTTHLQSASLNANSSFRKKKKKDALETLQQHWYDIF